MSSGAAFHKVLEEELEAEIEQVHSVLKNEVASLTSKREAFEASIAESHRKLRLENQEFDDMLRNRIRENTSGLGHAGLSSVVKFNVGGEKMEIDREIVLSNEPDSLLAALLSRHHPVVLDNDGCIFIDRDPRRFAACLAFLERQELPILTGDKEHDECLLRQLILEAEYWSLSHFHEVLLGMR